LNQKTESREIETLTEKVTIEIHRIGASIAPYLPKSILQAIPATAAKLKNLNSNPWLVDFSIRKENGKTVIVLESRDGKEVTK